MHKLIRELRRREVFRSAGLYVGISWIIIEVASVLVPTFEGPEWVLQALFIVAFGGFPVALVLAWFYDLNESGIVRDDETVAAQTETIGGRKMDFVVIGVLSVALMFSVYLNVTRDAGGPVTLDPVSVLIADFDNQTGNTVFDGSLESALALGIEGASFVTTFRRDHALRQAKLLELGDTLNIETARLVAVRQNVRMVLAGSIAPKGKRFALTLQSLNPATGDVFESSSTTAKTAGDVLMAINELAADFRKAMGERSEDLDLLAAGETLTATSLEAMKFYATAQELARAGDDEEAIAQYAKAIEVDPSMARAYSGWGLSAHKLGRPKEAEEKWQKALSLLDRMTKRERLRTLGLYYTVVSLDYAKGIDNYEQLVREFPADGAGNNNLAILYVMTAKFDRAYAQSKNVLKIYPARPLYLANHAQHAVYAGDMATAKEFAQRVLAVDASFFKSYMVLALVALHEGDTEAARTYYTQMAATGTRGASLANIGLADIAIFEGDFDAAVEILADGIKADEDNNNPRGRETKLIALAHAYVGKGNEQSALEAIGQIEKLRGDGQLVPAAERLAAAGRNDDAVAIGEQYRAQLGPMARAYTGLVDGIVAHQQGRYVAAIDAYREAIGHADLWLVRFHLARAYLDAGHAAAALAELDACIARRSEAGGLFFDDVPTWRYTAELNAWKSKASAALTQPPGADSGR